MKRSRIVTLTSASTFIWSVIDLIKGLSSAFQSGQLHLSEVKGLVGVSFAILLYLSDDDRVKRAQDRDREPVSEAPELVASLKAGVLGGLLGGLVAGLPFALYYYFEALPHNGFVSAVGSVAEIVVYALIVGLMIGIFVVSFLYASAKYRGFREIAVGALGGAIAGLVVGLIAGYTVGLRDTDPISYGWLIGTATFGAAWIACGSLLFEYKINLSSAASALAIVFLIEIVIAFAGNYALVHSRIDLTSPANSLMAMNVGGEIGVICGSLLGIQITATLAVYRFLSGRKMEENLPGEKRRRVGKRSRKKRGPSRT